MHAAAAPIFTRLLLQQTLHTAVKLASCMMDAGVWQQAAGCLVLLQSC
jgi:hypothetical protein